MSQDMADLCLQRAKMNYWKPLLLTLGMYLIVQGLGIWVSGGGLWVETGVVEKVSTGEIQPVVENPEKPESSAQIFIYIIFMTIVLLILLKYKFDIIIKIFMFISFLFGLSFTFWNLIGEIGIFIAIILLAIGYWQRKNFVVMNIVLIFTIPGIGSWLGASLSFIPSLILLVGLAIYDIIAVFGTKHMVKLAEGAKGKIPLMFAIPIEERFLGLGTGDFAIPVVFSTSILRDYTFQNSVFAVIGGLFGLVGLFIYIINKKDVALPALPPIAVGMILGFIVSLFVQL